MKRVLSIALLSVVFLFAFSLRARASVSDNMAGWAWSASSGWISFNCTNDSSCGTSSYGVNKNGDGTLTGYAWSSGVGWIQFGGLSSFPSGSGTYSQNAQMSGASLRGWAKAIGADGISWDGWISLSGSSPTYGVSQTALTFTGYAWGGDTLGWIQFDPGTQNPGVCPSACDVRVSGDASFDIKNAGISIASTTVAYNTAASLVYTITNLPSVSCSLSKTGSATTTAFTTVSGITVSGTSTTAALGTGAYVFALNCTTPTISQTLGFTVAAQPASFSLGGNDTATIQFLGATDTYSQTRNIGVTGFGGYTGNVTVTVTNVTPSLPASTTMAYSLGGGAFISWPSGPTGIVLVPNGAGSTFQAKVTRLGGAPAFGGPYTVTLSGNGVGSSSPATEDIQINPTTFNPNFQNI